MLFVAVALIIVAGLALLISADAGQLLGLTQVQTGQLIPLIILLLVFAAGVAVRRKRIGEMVGNFAIWLAIFGVALIGYAYRDDLSVVANRVFGELVPAVAVVDVQSGTATFRRGRGGHFEVDTRVNGAPIRMIFDTGASAVVLTDADARAAGINTAQLNYNVVVSTANGNGRAAAVTLTRIEVGGIVRDHIRAFIAAPGALDTSLLGMSYLETLDRYSVTSNSLELAG